MKKNKFISKLKLYCIMSPIVGLALAPVSNVGKVNTEVNKTFEKNENDFSNGINAMNFTEAIATYALEEMKKQKQEGNDSVNLTPYETDTTSNTQQKVAEQRAKKEKEKLALLKRIMETSDAADEVKTSKEQIKKEKNDEKTNIDESTAYLNSDVYKEALKELNEETDKEKLALLKRIMETSDAANEVENINISDEKTIVEIGGELDKEEILNNFKECKTLKDIDKRRKELESLNLTDDDKIYKNCKASAEMQHFIYEQSIINGYPFDFMLSIISTETRDEFNANGVAAYNKGCNNYDLGYAQQNSEWSLPVFQKKFNLKYKDAYNLLLNDDYANVCAAFLEFEQIDKCHKTFDPYEYAGCYNGWTTWRKKETSTDYVYNHFMPTYDKKYNEHHSVEKEKHIKEKTNVKKK